MRKAWQRIFLLCIACLVCMGGVCLAKEDDGNWVQYYYHDDINIFYVDTDSIKTCEYEGRKYLEAKIKRKKTQVEDYVVFGRMVEVTGAEFHILFDVENRKAMYLEWYNEAAKSGRKKGKRDISLIKNGGESIEGHPGPEKLLPWIEQNYPSIINEIRTFNQSVPQSAPGANTGATGAPKVPSGSLEAIVGDIEYEVLDSGAVKFSPRCMAYTGLDDSNSFSLYEPSYFIFAKPEKYSAWPGAYVVGFLNNYYDDATISTHVEVMNEDAFDYDPKTQTFTFYNWEPNPREVFIFYRMRVIDKNTVCITEDSKGYANTYRYMPYDKLPVKSQIVDGVSVTVEENSMYNWNYCDRNNCVWCGDHAPYFWPDVGRLNAVVDMARAFLAVNGKVGTAPEGYNVMSYYESLNHDEVKEQ